jgi:hypothetical protein
MQNEITWHYVIRHALRNEKNENERRNLKEAIKNSNKKIRKNMNPNGMKTGEYLNKAINKYTMYRMTPRLKRVLLQYMFSRLHHKIAYMQKLKNNYPQLNNKTMRQFITKHQR